MRFHIFLRHFSSTLEKHAMASLNFSLITLITCRVFFEKSPLKRKMTCVRDGSNDYARFRAKHGLVDHPERPQRLLINLCNPLCFPSDPFLRVLLFSHQMLAYPSNGSESSYHFHNFESCLIGSMKGRRERKEVRKVHNHNNIKSTREFLLINNFFRLPGIGIQTRWIINKCHRFKSSGCWQLVE